jgi:glycosyltransferase involved in cell wall biosynthesis
MNISIIIPTYNEEQFLKETLRHLRSIDSSIEIIISDGHSTDNTTTIANTYGSISVQSQKERAKQLNKGAKKATGDVLFFMHADNTPPKTFIADITTAVNQGYEAGSFYLKYKEANWLLNHTYKLSTINKSFIRFGDQGLFITKKLFKETKGFDENSSC